MRISVTKNLSDPSSTVIDTDLVTWLRQSKATSKEQAQLWSPCIFSDGSRKQVSGTELTCLALDFDSDVSPECEAELARYYYLLHPSPSFTEASPRFRAVLFLDRAVPAKDWGRFWDNFTARVKANCDPACKNVGRFYFAPLAGQHVAEFPGDVVRVDDFLGEQLDTLKKQLLKTPNPEMLALVKLALAGKQLAEEGNRDNTVSKLGFYLGKHVAPAGTSAEAVLALLPLVLPGNEPRSHWEDKFQHSYEKGYAEREARQEKQANENHQNEAWGEKLQIRQTISGDTAIISNTFNANLILQHEGTFKFRKNLVEERIEMNGEPFQDADATMISNWLQQKYRIALTSGQVFEQANLLASNDAYDPIKDYLHGLVWDGVSRRETFLIDHLGCTDTPVVRAYSKKWPICLVARALEPGCKMDDVLVLHGNQGLGKSTALKILGGKWFSDSKIIIGDKDSMLTAGRSWLHEFADLGNLRKADLETIKGFFTSTQDTFRPPYGRVAITRPRRCVFVATTNDVEFLTDPTGARRFWVATVERAIDFEAIARERDQLLAEAVHAYKAGEKWYLDENERDLQNSANDCYQIPELESKTELIRQWWENQGVKPLYLTTHRVVLEIWNVAGERANRSQEMEAGRCLRKLGFRRSRRGSERVYEPPEEWKTLEIELNVRPSN